MTTTTPVAAVDLGAESGRVAEGQLRRHPPRPRRRQPLRALPCRRPRRPALGPAHPLDRGPRRPRRPRRRLGSQRLASVGVDAWGVDYGLIDADGTLVDSPTCYRDHRQVEAYDQALDTVGARRLYAATGVQVIPINTVFALASDAQTMPARLERAATLLMLPDVFHHLLSGTSVTEYSAASTSGCYDMAEKRWATGLLDDLGIPTHLLPEVVAPGTEVGPLLDDLATGALRGARVVMPPGHDTASAVVVHRPPTSPASTSRPAPWSLVGIEVPDPGYHRRRHRFATSPTRPRTPAITYCSAPTSRRARCSSPAAATGRRTDRPTRTRSSLSLPEPPGHYAASSTPTRPTSSTVRTRPPASSATARPPGHPCRRRPARSSVLLDSLALSYRAVVDDLQDVTGYTIPSVNIVGGGSNNALLSQLTADATGLPVRTAGWSRRRPSATPPPSWSLSARSTASPRSARWSPRRAR